MTVEYLDKLTNLHTQGLELFKKKNHDYGNAYERYGIMGIIIRISDKISRLENITKKQITMVNDESLRDTLVDLNNYSSLGLMLLDKYSKKI